MPSFINHGKIINTDYGVRIRIFREANGYTQQEFANTVGLTQSTIAKLEREDISLTIETAANICKAIPAMDFIWLITGVEK